MPVATLNLGIKNYTSWSLGNRMMVRRAGLDLAGKMVEQDDVSALPELLLLASLARRLSLSTQCMRRS